MACTNFCSIPGNAKAEEKCKNPYCGYPMANHYSFGKPREDGDDEKYEKYLLIWKYQKEIIAKELKEASKKITETLIIPHLLSIYNSFKREEKEES